MKPGTMLAFSLAMSRTSSSGCSFFWPAMSLSSPGCGKSAMSGAALPATLLRISVSNEEAWT